MPSQTGFDPATELGVIFEQEIPTGEGFEPWLLDEVGMGPFVSGMESVGYSVEELPLTIAILSHGRWAPSVSVIRQLAES